MDKQLIVMVLFLIFYVIISFTEYKKKSKKKTVDKRFIDSKILGILITCALIAMNVTKYHFGITLFFGLLSLIMSLIKMNKDGDKDLFLYVVMLINFEVIAIFFSVYVELKNCPYKNLSFLTSIGVVIFFTIILVSYIYYFKRIVNSSKIVIQILATLIVYIGTYIFTSIPFGFCYHINDVFINVTSQNQILVKNNNVNKKNPKNKVDKSGENLIEQVFFKGFSGFFNYSADTYKKRITYVTSSLNQELERNSQKVLYNRIQINKFNESIKAISKSNLSNYQKN